MRIETFEQLLNIGAGRQFRVSKAHQRKARNRFRKLKKIINFILKALKIMSGTKNYPKSFSHIGITVSNIKDAVKFYCEVMGWYVIMEPSVVKKEKETAIGLM